MCTLDRRLDLKHMRDDGHALAPAKNTQLPSTTKPENVKFWGTQGGRKTAKEIGAGNSDTEVMNYEAG